MSSLSQTILSWTWNVSFDPTTDGFADLWGFGSVDLLAADEVSNMVDLCIASYSDHLHANILRESS